MIRPLICKIRRAISSLILATIFLAALPGLVLAKCPAVSSTVPSGLVGWWKLDETSGTTAADSSGNGNTGTLNNGPVWTTGHIDGALGFDGVSQYVSSGAVFSNLGVSNQPYSLSAWINAASGVTAGDIMHVSDSSNGRGWCLPMIALSGGQIVVNSYNGGTVSVVSNAVITSGQWYHVVHTWDPTNGLRLYINGVLDNMTAQATFSASGSSDYVFLAFDQNCNGDPGAFFKGTIDDARVYNRALSAGEVAQLYGEGSTGDIVYNGDYRVPQFCNGTSWVAMAPPLSVPSTGMAGWWKLDESSGSASDSSGNGNTGFLINAPTWQPTGGQIAGALQLNGTNQYVNAADAAVLNPAGSWTISTWVNMAALPAGGAMYPLMEKTISTGYAAYILAVDNTGTNCPSVPAFETFFTDTSSSSQETCSTTSVTANAWHLVTGVWDAVGMQEILYVDGVQVNAIARAAPPMVGSGGTLYLGNNGSTSYANATLDDERIYGRALSAAEVAGLYISGRGSSVPSTGLIHYWKLDEAPGATTAADSAGSANATKTGSSVDFTTSGLINDAVTLPNDGLVKYFSVASPSDIKSQSAQTISMWFKRATSTSIVQTGHYDSSGGTWMGMEVWSDGYIYFDFSASIYARVATSDTNWHLATMVFDGTKTGNANRLTAYIDGVQQTLGFGGTIPATTPASTSYFIGAVTGSGADTDAGTIDDVRIYNRALSNTEVYNLYRYSGGKVACSSPAGNEGDMVYNSASHVFQYCGNAGWVAMSKQWTGSDGGGCSSPTGSAGQMMFNNGYCVPQYCDSNVWQAIGSPHAPVCGLCSGTLPKMVFVTSTSYTGAAVASVANANSICAARATAAGLSGTYKAWVAVNRNVDDPGATFTQSAGPYTDVKCTVIANNWAGLISGTLLNGISTNELGAAVAANTNVWTNVNTDGTAYANGSSTIYNCAAWTNGTSGDNGLNGITGDPSSNWTAAGNSVACNASARLYCFQQ